MNNMTRAVSVSEIKTRRENRLFLLDSITLSHGLPRYTPNQVNRTYGQIRSAHQQRMLTKEVPAYKLAGGKSPAHLARIARRKVTRNIRARTKLEANKSQAALHVASQ
jgi:hypothetical protein